MKEQGYRGHQPACLTEPGGGDRPVSARPLRPWVMFATPWGALLVIAVRVMGPLFSFLLVACSTPGVAGADTGGSGQAEGAAPAPSHPTGNPSPLPLALDGDPAPGGVITQHCRGRANICPGQKHFRWQDCSFNIYHSATGSSGQSPANGFQAHRERVADLNHGYHTLTTLASGESCPRA